MRLTESLLLAGALLVAAPAVAQDNASVNNTAAAAPATADANNAAAADANAVPPLDMNTAENMTIAAPPHATPVQTAPPAPRGFPFGVLGLLGLIGLFGAKKAKG